MRTIEAFLKEEKKQLEKIVEETKKRLVNVPGGHLRITKKRQGVEYYYKDEADAHGQTAKKKCDNGRYVKKQEYELVKQIIQRDYDSSLVKYAEE